MTIILHLKYIFNGSNSHWYIIIIPGHVDVVRALIEFGAKVDAETISKLSALHTAAFNGKEITHLK